MKAILMIALAVWAGAANAQSLKEALYGGRLKNDTGAVIKKGDTLQIRENMAKKVADDSLKKVTVAAAVASGDTTARIVADMPVETTTPAGTTTTTTETAAIAAPVAAAPKDNNKLWKDFVEEYTAVIKTEVLPNKKIKAGTYAVLIEYEIGVDGYVTTQNIYCTPENSFLKEQIKLRMMANAPDLQPLLQANGKPRKALKKQSLTFVKDKD
jgi:hypothetical protein